MRLWNVSKIRRTHLKDPRLQALARAARDWLNVFIEGAEDSALGQELPTGPTAPDLGKAAVRARDGSEFAPDSGNEQYGGVSTWNGQQPVGPPEDWLRRVRESAPGLLRSVEEGGVPWANSPRRAIENGQPQQETISEQSFSEQSFAEQSLPRFRATAAPKANQRTEAGMRQPLATELPRLSSWLQSLRKRLRPSAFTLKEEKTELRPHLDPSTPEVRRRAFEVVTPTPAPAGQKSKGESTRQHRRAPQSTLSESEQPAASTTSHWRERLRQGIRTALPISAANVSAANAHIDHPAAHKSEDPFSATSGTTQPVSARVSEKPTAKRPSVELDDVSLRPPATFVRLNTPLDWNGRGHGGSRPERQVNVVSELPPNSPSWPSVPVGVEHFRNHASEREGARISLRHSREEAPASQPVQRLQLDSVKSPESLQSDLWPELPNDIPRATTDQTQFLRNAERLRALDIEQRGGH